eukprot:364767-Chlamydomonas_euryale.AAC.4
MDGMPRITLGVAVAGSWVRVSALDAWVRPAAFLHFDLPPPPRHHTCVPLPTVSLLTYFDCSPHTLLPFPASHTPNNLDPMLAKLPLCNTSLPVPDQPAHRSLLNTHSCNCPACAFSNHLNSTPCLPTWAPPPPHTHHPTLFTSQPPRHISPLPGPRLGARAAPHAHRQHTHLERDACQRRGLRVGHAHKRPENKLVLERAAQYPKATARAAARARKRAHRALSRVPRGLEGVERVDAVCARKAGKRADERAPHRRLLLRRARKPRLTASVLQGACNRRDVRERAQSRACACAERRRQRRGAVASARWGHGREAAWQLPRRQCGHGVAELLAVAD